MKSTIDMDQIKGNRIIISGLVSSKVRLDESLPPLRAQIQEAGGEIVGELIQRRGVSRSKKVGGSGKLDSPLSSRTYISSGKVDELKKLSQDLNAELVVFVNDLTDRQIENPEDWIELNSKGSSPFTVG